VTEADYQQIKTRQMASFKADVDAWWEKTTSGLEGLGLSKEDSEKIAGQIVVDSISGRRTVSGVTDA
jgi:hypothetical protein